ncbi:MAG: presenilin family intramembrane aspartyl protease [Candidatus Nanohaloarchaea archaeon]|nr:presenilin family intramembrane aspartyl protease [Candidatus Nanohaloarchaea archaeon]
MGWKRPNIPLLAVFFLSHFYGILAALNLEATPLSQGSAVVNQSPLSGLYLVLMIVAVTGLMLLLYKYKLKFLTKIWFYLAITVSILAFFLSFLPALPTLIIAICLIMLRIRTRSMWTRNIIDIFSYAGVGALFGTMIGWIPAAIFLVLLSVYDTVSVFMTGHMVSLAEEGLDTDTFMGVMYPKGDVEPDKVEQINKTVKGHGDANSSEVRIGVVGGGDIIAPMIFSISLIESFGMLSAFLSSLGAMTGLYFLMNWMEEGRYYPALPIIGLGAALGLLLSLLFHSL